MSRKAYESLYGNNEFYNRIAAPVMWSPWAIVRSEHPVFVLPDTFGMKAGAMDGRGLIAPLTPAACFVTLPGLEQQKRIIPHAVRADEDLSRRISLALALPACLHAQHGAVLRGGIVGQLSALALEAEVERRPDFEPATDPVAL